MTVLAAAEAYRLWAPTYASENAVTHLEQMLVAAMTPPLSGLRLLDAGCGTGRRLRHAGAASAVGVDLSPEMIAAGRARGEGWGDVTMMVGDLRALPLPERAFDVVWCRLAIGHVADRGRVYAELARVADAGATVIVSDFHPDASAAGHRRTFRHEGEIHEVEHHVHAPSAHLASAREAGLLPIEVRDARIGPEVRRFYDAAGRGDAYQEHLGLPIVLAMRFRRGT